MPHTTRELHNDVMTLQGRSFGHPVVDEASGWRLALRRARQAEAAQRARDRLHAAIPLLTLAPPDGKRPA